MSDEYQSVKQELKALLADRKELEDKLDKLQQDIYDKESEYFDVDGGSKSYHNILRGFDGMSRTQSNNSNMTNNDRIFSLSSASYVKQVQDQ